MAKLKEAALDDEQKKELASLEEKLKAAETKLVKAQDAGDDELERVSESTVASLLEEMRELRKEQREGWQLFASRSGTQEGKGDEGKKKGGFLEWLFEE